MLLYLLLVVVFDPNELRLEFARTHAIKHIGSAALKKEGGKVQRLLLKMFAVSKTQISSLKEQLSALRTRQRRGFGSGTVLKEHIVLFQVRGKMA